MYECELAAKNNQLFKKEEGGGGMEEEGGREGGREGGNGGTHPPRRLDRRKKRKKKEVRKDAIKVVSPLLYVAFPSAIVLSYLGPNECLETRHHPGLLLSAPAAGAAASLRGVPDDGVGAAPQRIHQQKAGIAATCL